MSTQIILASASPRRLELLRQIGVTCTVRSVDLDETPRVGELPLHYVERIAAEKSAAVFGASGSALPVLAADTAVVVDDRILGKPKDEADGRAMLASLSGRRHRVYSAISLRGKRHWQAVSISCVTFRTIGEPEISAYWRSGEPADKAGAYAIQGLGAVFVESLEGSFSGIMGLPLFETAKLLAKEGITVLQ